MIFRRFWTLSIGLHSFVLAGCATTHTISVVKHETAKSNIATKSQPKPVADVAIRQVAAEEKVEDSSIGGVRPAYGQLETLPIDLPAVIRMVDQNSPAIGIAQARIREAQARLASANTQWLPNLSVGFTYNRFDGQTQNQRGDVFGVSRANLFGGGGAALNFDVAEAIYAPLIAKRLSNAAHLRSTAVLQFTELEAVTAYLDLVQIHAQLAINADTLTRAEAMLTAAKNAKEAKLDRIAGDVNRAQTEVLFRRVERIELEGRVGVFSARLGKLLLLPPTVRLVPAEVAIVPVSLIDPTATIDQLIGIAIVNRPDLATNRELVAAAWARVRKQEHAVLLPRLTIANQTGGYGGGFNDKLQNFSSRNALSMQLYWEVKNLGFGNRADVAEKRATRDQASLQLVEEQARAVSEIVEAAQIAAARYESLDLAERAVKEATELYRINKEGTFNVIDAKNLFDALRPLQSIQTLNQARQNYLSAVVDFNRAQYRLFTFIGNPPGSVPVP